MGRPHRPEATCGVRPRPPSHDWCRCLCRRRRPPPCFAAAATTAAATVFDLQPPRTYVGAPHDKHHGAVARHKHGADHRDNDAGVRRRPREQDVVR